MRGLSLIGGYLLYLTAEVDNCFNVPIFPTTVFPVIVLFLVSFDKTGKYGDYLSLLRTLSSEKSSCMNENAHSPNKNHTLKVTASFAVVHSGHERSHRMMEWKQPGSGFFPSRLSLYISSLLSEHRGAKHPKRLETKTATKESTTDSQTLGAHCQNRVWGACMCWG